MAILNRLSRFSVYVIFLIFHQKLYAENAYRGNRKFQIHSEKFYSYPCVCDLIVSVPLSA